MPPIGLLFISTTRPLKLAPPLPRAAGRGASAVQPSNKRPQAQSRRRAIWMKMVRDREEDRSCRMGEWRRGRGWNSAARQTSRKTHVARPECTTRQALRQGAAARFFWECARGAARQVHRHNSAVRSRDGPSAAHCNRLARKSHLLQKLQQIRCAQSGKLRYTRSRPR